MANFRTVLGQRFGGLLRKGAHQPDSLACALEAASVTRGIAWTDDPIATGLPDLRALNDAPWPSDVARTQALVPIVEAYWEWASWPTEYRARVAKRLVELTIRQVLPIALRAANLTYEADQWEREGTRAARSSIANSARSALARDAITDALNASDAAAAARAVAHVAYFVALDATAARDDILKTACQCWIDAVELSNTKGKE